VTTTTPEGFGLVNRVTPDEEVVPAAMARRLLERLGQSVLIRTEDAQDGMAAFAEKRRARFSGQ
jgi:hypothetical protein